LVGNRNLAAIRLLNLITEEQPGGGEAELRGKDSSDVAESWMRPA
jgi:hypothetical protein